jgi:hypothetical protein
MPPTIPFPAFLLSGIRDASASESLSEEDEELASAFFSWCRGTSTTFTLGAGLVLCGRVAMEERPRYTLLRCSLPSAYSTGFI